MKDRPIVILYQNKIVEKSYKSIAKLTKKGKLDKAEWVLIPIYHTGSTYIAVSGAIFSTQLKGFSTGTVRYHMEFCNDCGVSDPTEESVEILWDYETITISVESIEEFYNAIYQPVAFAYLRSLRPFSDRDIDFWFIHIKDIEITAYNKNGKEIDSFICSADAHVGAVPFPYDDGDIVVDEMAVHFGLSMPGQSRYRHDIAFKKLKNGQYIWEESPGRIMMFSWVKGVAVSSGAYCSFVLLSDADFCAFLRLNTAVIYATPLAVTIDSPKNIMECLAVATKYDIPKYVFGQFYETEYEIKVEPLFADYGMQLCHSSNIELLDATDICVFIEHSYYYMQILKEGTHVFIANNINLDSLKDLEYCGTAILECHVELDTDAEPAMDEKYRDFSIYSDPWQDYPPRAKEVCYLIQLAEKEK